MNNKDITEINIDLLFRQRNKFLVMGNVAFKLRNLWYYLYKGGKK